MDLDLEQLPKEIRNKVESIVSENAQLTFQVRHLKEQLRLAYLKKYGRSSEKLDENQLKLLEGEPSVTEAEVKHEAAAGALDQEEQCEEPASPRRRKRNRDHPGRVDLPAHLERREVIIPCEEPECHCGTERPVIGYEISEELDVDPAKYFVNVIKREKRGSHCQAEDGVITAPVPPKIVPKSKLSNEMIIDMIIKKYDEHMPVYRQCAAIERDADVELSRQTLVETIMATGDLMRPVVGALATDLIEGGYIQADETPVPCQVPEPRGRNHRAYMWEYSRPGGPVVFDFQMGRGRNGPQAFLKGFNGKLQCDGYSAYDDLGDGITYVACLAHIRREFYRAHKLAPNDPQPLEILNEIDRLYRIEREAREGSVPVEERYRLRQEQSEPIMAALKSRIFKMRQEVQPASQLGKACNYALGQWQRLEEVLKDGRIEIDNNWAENAIRPLTLGRKNWLHIGSERAGPRIAAIASIIETCRRLDINVRKYLREVLPKLPEWPINRVAELSPLAWKSPDTS